MNKKVKQALILIWNKYLQWIIWMIYDTFFSSFFFMLFFIIILQFTVIQSEEKLTWFSIFKLFLYAFIWNFSVVEGQGHEHNFFLTGNVVSIWNDSNWSWQLDYDNFGIIVVLWTRKSYCFIQFRGMKYLFAYWKVIYFGNGFEFNSLKEG